MTSQSFQALVARQGEHGQSLALETLTDADLPEAAVTVDIDYSSFNYKDGLALTGRGRILRHYPIIPGIDFAGRVSHSTSKSFTVGDKVVLTGWGVGEAWPGGFSQRARVKPEWLVGIPAAIGCREAMIIGTAGLTAMLCVMALERHGIRKDGRILVTGAAGGVGSIAIRLLSRLGYQVTALTGRPNEQAFFEALGAVSILHRAEMEGAKKPLRTERWDGVIDSVGGVILANAISELVRGGAAAACGLVAGSELPTTVLPFILRGVALLGVDSVYCPPELRKEAWHRLARDLHAEDLYAVAEEVRLDDLPARAEAILAGHIRGRTVVNVQAHSDRAGSAGS